jgi:hypothetical protein
MRSSCTAVATAAREESVLEAELTEDGNGPIHQDQQRRQTELEIGELDTGHLHNFTPLRRGHFGSRGGASRLCLPAAGRG